MRGSRNRLSWFAVLGLGAVVAAPPAPAWADPPPPTPPITVPRPEDRKPALVGSRAPKLKATAHNGEAIDLGKMKGQLVAVYFYPKDDTPGCTKQACDIRDNWQKLQDAGVKVIGVSTQDNESHKAFASKHNLPFPLLADDKGKIASDFGVPIVDGKAKRMTFLVGKDGKIKHVWEAAATTGHAAEILSVVQAEAAPK
ncbi:MAG TPA: peroxiredoxin [Polyangia bacterium]